MRRVIHSDPSLPGTEINGHSRDVEPIRAESLTQSIAHSAGWLTGKTVAVSTSATDDPTTDDLPLPLLRQRDLVVELARRLFAAEARIAYGGDFRQAGFTELLVEVQRLHASATGAPPQRIVSYRLEPLPAEVRAKYFDAVRFVEVRFIDVARGADDSATAKARSRAMSLRALRSEIARDVVALVAVGGRTSGFAGWRPGVAEEIAAAVAAGKPTYLVGGCGGSAGAYAQAAYLGGESPDIPAPAELGPETTGALALPSADEVVLALRGTTSRNGLTAAENSLLARTEDQDEIVALVLSGLARISK